MTSYNYLTLPVPAQFCSDAWLTHHKNAYPKIMCMYVVQDGTAESITITASTMHHMHIKWIPALYAYIEMKVREHAKNAETASEDERFIDTYVENYLSSNHLS